MTATNHALTGALIGLAIHQPVIAVPVAFISHYILDALPHSGGLIKVGSKQFRYYLLVEAALCFLIVLALYISQPSYWWLGAICAFVAASPDFMWMKNFIHQQKGGKQLKPRWWLVKLHSKVQWFEKPIGTVVELVWAVAAVSLLAIFLKK